MHKPAASLCWHLSNSELWILPAIFTVIHDCCFFCSLTNCNHVVLIYTVRFLPSPFTKSGLKVCREKNKVLSLPFKNAGIKLWLEWYTQRKAHFKSFFFPYYFTICTWHIIDIVTQLYKCQRAKSCNCVNSDISKIVWRRKQIIWIELSLWIACPFSRRMNTSYLRMQN